MKKYLFTITTILGCLAPFGLRAQIFWYDALNYNLGNITNGSGLLWLTHSGGVGDSLEVNYAGSAAAAAGHRYEVNQSRQDDIHRWFFPNTNGFAAGAGVSLYASFTISMTNLPGNAGGTYFAHFMDGGTSFRCRIFALTAGAYPGTWRVGVAGGANGDFSAGTGGPSAVVPIDLALSTDYRVVMKMTTAAIPQGTVWINPASESDAANSASSTDVISLTNAMTAFAFRQSSGEGVMELSNLAVGTNFNDVVTNTAAIPVVGLDPASVTNYSGNPASLEVAASGMGVLTYQWYQNGSPISGATSQTYSIASLSGTDEGSYYCAITNSAGGTNSGSAYVSVNTTPTPPTFITQPQSRTNSYGSTATFTTSVYGTGPLTYQWTLNSNPLADGTTGTGSTIAGASTANLTVSKIGPSDAGTYVLSVTGGAGNNTSSNAVMTVIPPPLVNISFLRTLQDPVNYLATDGNTLYKVHGIITTFTNLTSGNTSSSYIQDSTAGLNLFVTFGSWFRPARGDEVTATGFLSSFNSTLELVVDMTNNVYAGLTNHSSGNVLPAPRVISPLITNDIATTEALEGSVVMLTNVFFTNTATIGSANTRVSLTNAAGVPFIIFFPAGQDQDLRTKVLPRFAWTIQGALTQNNPNTAQPRNALYDITVTRFSDIVTNAPTAVAVTETRSADTTTLNWTAVPRNYSYSVLASSTVTGPYTPIATGLTFTNTAGTYTDVDSGGPKFYRVASP